MEFQQQAIEADHKAILAKATKNAANKLGLTFDELAKIIGKNRTTINRGIDPATKAGELALLFVRCYYALHTLVGGDPKHMKHWFGTRNKHLNGVPRELVKSVQGLNSVLIYLDGMRGR